MTAMSRPHLALLRSRTICTTRAMTISAMTRMTTTRVTTDYLRDDAKGANKASDDAAMKEEMSRSKDKMRNQRNITACEACAEKV